MNRYLDIKQLSELLSVKAKTIYGWVQDGRIPSYKFGTLLRFKESDVEEWAEKRRREAVSKKKRLEKISQDVLTKL